MKDHALAYAAKGWPIFPCREKIPLTRNGVLDASTDPKAIAAWWRKWPDANIGFAAGEAGIVVLDYDLGHDPEFHAGMPVTAMTVATPRGGVHDYYQLLPGEQVAPSASAIAKHVDVRSHNSYVLLPPSRTKDGDYRWSGEGKPSTRPQMLIDHRPATKSAKADVWEVEPDLPENIDRAIDWLSNKAKVAVEGEGGDAMAFSTGAMMKSYAISLDKAKELILEHWNPRCTPPWTEDVEHLMLKIENAYEYNSSPPGNLVPQDFAPMFQRVVEIDDKDNMSLGRFRITSMAGLRNVKPMQWLVDDFIPDGGLAIMYGAPGSYKTFLALDVALSVATGASFPWAGLWSKISEPGPVLFAAGEGRANLANRVFAWRQRHWPDHDLGNFYLIDPVPLVSGNLKPFIDLALKMSPTGYRLVVIDTIGRAMSGLNENAQEHASKFTEMAGNLTRALGGAVLALHHTGHKETERARGSSVYGADADTMIRVDYEDADVSLTMTKQKDAEEWGKPKTARLEKVSLSEDAGSLVVVAAKGREVSENNSEKINYGALTLALDASICNVLKSFSGPKKWTQRELAHAVAMEPGVEVTSKTLANIWLPRIRETKGTHANRCYNPVTRRWSWVEEEKK